MAKQNPKTNVIRHLEAAEIPFTYREFDVSGGVPSGVEMAALLGQDPDYVFKTLVTKGASGGHYVFVIPVAATLNLKKAAKAAGEKSIEMIRQAELLPLTGYIHGGCSPIGMKKPFPTFFAEEMILIDTIMVSGGRPGLQIQLAPDDLLAATGGTIADLT